MTRTMLALAATLAPLAFAAACSGRPAPITIACPAGGTDDAAAAATKSSSMTVSGTATLEIIPDTADMHITLGAELSRPRAAAQMVRAKQAALTKALTAIGLEPGDVSLSYLSVGPVYDDKGHLIDYAAAITVTATTHDFDRLAEIMEASAVAGATATSTDFRVADLSSLKKKVRAEALAALKDKAEQTTGALGVKLGRVRAIAENQGGEAWGWNGNVAVANSVDFQPRTQTGTKADAQSLTLTITATYDLGEG